MFLGIRKAFPYTVAIKPVEYHATRAETISNVDALLPRDLKDWLRQQRLPDYFGDCSPIYMVPGDTLKLTFKIKVRTKKEAAYIKLAWG